jgi:hypothetical protein
MDGGLIFKVVFMASVLSARMTKNIHKNGGGKNTTTSFWAASSQMAVGITFLLFGLLYHVGYIPYLYKFCVQEGIPRRIWQEEDNATMGNGADAPNHPLTAGGAAQAPRRGDVQDAAAAAEQQDDNEDNDNNVPVAVGWQWGTFLRGRIPRFQPADGADVDGAIRIQPHFLWVAVQDIFYLVGSFVFSIFPMWEPQAAAVVAQVAAAPIGDGQPPQQQQRQQLIPRVAPPRDPAEPEEEEDEEEEEGDY